MFGGVEFRDYPDPDNVSRLDHGALPMISDMHKYGIRLDVPHLQSMSRDIGNQLTDIEYESSIILGSYQDTTGKGTRSPFKITSPDHVSRLLFQYLKVQGDDLVPMTEKGARFATGDDILNLFKDRHPIIQCILDHRGLFKLKGTYTDALPLLVDSDSRIHTTFNVTQAATGRLSSSNPNCFDEHTEILTPDGWKYIKDAIYFNCQVAQWDDGKISFVLPTGNTKGHSADLVEIRNQHIDLCVTADHRCLLRNRKTGELRVFEAVNYPEDWEQIQAGEYSGPGGDLSHDGIRFMLATQADGSWMPNGGLDFSFKKERKVQRFEKLISALHLKHRKVPKDTNGRTRYYVEKCPFLERLHTMLGPDKLLPWNEFLAMNGEALDVVKAEVMFWDGCWTRKNHYASKHRHNTEVIATVFSLRGERAKIRKYVNQAGSVSWQADVTRRGYSLTTNRKKQFVKRSGFIYCVSVPSSYLLVRRNGCVMVTGNCQNIPIKTKLGKLIRKAFIARRGYVLVSSDLAQIEMVWAAHRSQDPTMMEVFQLGQDIHTRTACIVFQLVYDYIMALTRRAEEKLKKLGREVAEADPEVQEYLYFKQFQRLPCKSTGFGVLYGQTEQGLRDTLMGEGLDMSLELCKDFIDNKFFGAYPFLLKMLEKDWAFVKKYGMICDEFGRVRLVPQAKSSLKWLVSEGTRQAGNHPEQSSAQGTVKLSMAELTPIYRKMGDVFPLLQVHDQLIAEAPEHKAQEWADTQKWVMEHATPLSIPTRASSDIGNSWMEL